MRREVLVRAGLRFPVGLLHEDEYFSPLLLCLSGRTEAVDERFYFRRLRTGSIMTEGSADSIKRHFAHALLIYVRLKRDAGSMKLPIEGYCAIDMLLKKRYRYLAGNVYRESVSVLDIWWCVKGMAHANERASLFRECLCLAISVAARKYARHVRKFLHCLRKGG